MPSQVGEIVVSSSDRLDKIIADSGLGSRKQIRHLVRSGRVLVDGNIINDPAMRIIRGQHVIVADGQHVRQHPLTIMLNKPVGIVTATTDSRHQTVVDLLPPGMSRRIFPAGRLDKDTEGLLILTEDGDLCHRLISPKHGIEKQYVAQVTGNVADEIKGRFLEGIQLADGTVTLPAQFGVVHPKNDPFHDSNATHFSPAQLKATDSTPPGSTTVNSHTSFVTVTVTEGKYHQVRRMLAACGLHVEKLRRVRIGGLHIDPDLRPGHHRELSSAELKSLLSNPDDTHPISS